MACLSQGQNARDVTPQASVSVDKCMDDSASRDFSTYCTMKCTLAGWEVTDPRDWEPRFLSRGGTVLLC